MSASLGWLRRGRNGLRSQSKLVGARGSVRARISRMRRDCAGRARSRDNRRRSNGLLYGRGARTRRARQELERGDRAQRVPGMAARAIPEKRRAVETALAAPVACVAQHDVAHRARQRRAAARRVGAAPAGRNAPAMSLRSLSICSHSRTHSRIGADVVIAAEDGRVGDLRVTRGAMPEQLVDDDDEHAARRPTAEPRSASRGNTSGSRWKSRRTTPL